jgi:hypothetical protein
LELVKGPEGSWGRGGKQRIRPFCIVADKQVEAAMEGKSNAQLANVTALAPRRTMSTKAVIKLIVRQLPSISRATFLSLSVAAAHAAPLNCEDWNEDTPNQVALARVVTTQTRLHFIAGRDKRRPACPSLGSACKLKAFLVPGDEVLVNVTEQGPYVCATFKTQNGILTRGLLPRATLQVASPEQAPAQQWEGKWRRDSEAEIVIKSRGDEVEISGTATWGGSDPQRVKRGAINTGELNGSGKPRGQVLAIGYDPDRSAFPPSEHEAPDICAAQLELHGRYLMVEDNGRCGGLNVSFTGLYVRVAN